MTDKYKIDLVHTFLFKENSAHNYLLSLVTFISCFYIRVYIKNYVTQSINSVNIYSWKYLTRIKNLFQYS